jgi:hypothetical protein
LRQGQRAAGKSLAYSPETPFEEACPDYPIKPDLVETQLHSATRLPMWAVKSSTAKKIARLQSRIVARHLLLGHSSREPTQYIPNRDAETAYTRLTGPFSGLDPDSGGHA